MSFLEDEDDDCGKESLVRPWIGLVGEGVVDLGGDEEDRMGVSGRGGVRGGGSVAVDDAEGVGRENWRKDDMMYPGMIVDDGYDG